MDERALHDIAHEGEHIPAGDAEGAAPAPDQGELPGGAAAPRVRDPYAENRAVFGIMIAALAPMAPFLLVAYPPAVLDSISKAYTDVEIKRGWNLTAWLGGYDAEIALALALVPPTVQAAKLGAIYFAELRAKKAAQRAAAPAAAQNDASGWTETNATPAGDTTASGKSGKRK